MVRTRLRAGAVALAATVALLPACSDGGSAVHSPDTATSRATGGASSPPDPSTPDAPRSAASSPASSTQPGSPSSSPSSSSPSTSRRTTPAEVTIAVTGDVLPHPSVLHDAAANAGGSGWDFGPMLSSVAPVLRKADLAICQLETTLSLTDTGLTTANAFVSPHELAGDLVDAGFDGCSSANNHSLDAGLPGVRATRKVAARADLQLAGPAGSADRPGQPAMYDAGRLTVAQLSYSYTVDNAIEHNTTTPPAQAPWMRHSLYPARKPAGIIADARRARRSGADLVLVSMHWGNMFDATPTDEQQRYAEALLTSGEVDAIIGAHPHVVQPCRKIDGRYVLFSVGNFLSAQGPAAGLPAASQDGVIATLTFRRDRQGTIHQSLRFTPTQVVNPGHRVRIAPRGSASYQRTVSAMTSLGSACPTSVAD